MPHSNNQTSLTADNATASSTCASKDDSACDYAYEKEDSELRESTSCALRSSLQEAMHRAQKAGTWVPSIAEMANVRILDFKFDNLELDARAGCIAFFIEKALHQAYSNTKPYYDQARMLFYHLREEQILCDSLLGGDLDPRVLAIMTATQLRDFENGDRAPISFMGKLIKVCKPATMDAASTSSSEVVTTDIELIFEQMQQH